MKSLTKTVVALFLPAVLLSGCSGSGGKKAAAIINGEPITEDEFNEKVRNVGPIDLAGPAEMGNPLRAGEFAMQSLVYEKLLFQLAKERKAMPTEAEVNNYIPFAKKFQQRPDLTLLQPDPMRTEAAWRHDVRLALVRRNLAMAPLTITEDEIKKTYESVKTQIAPPDEYHLLMIDLKSPEKAAKALDSLAPKNGAQGMAFQTVALTQSEDPNSRQKAGDLGFVASNRMPPELLAAVKELKPNEYNKKPAVVKLRSGPNGAPETHYLIAQLIAKKPGQIPSLEEARPVALALLINQKDPNAFPKVQQEMVKYKDKANTQILLKPYEHILDKQPAPAGSGAPPAAGAPPAGAPATGMPPAGAVPGGPAGAPGR